MDHSVERPSEAEYTEWAHPNSLQARPHRPPSASASNRQLREGTGSWIEPAQHGPGGAGGAPTTKNILADRVSKQLDEKYALAQAQLASTRHELAALRDAHTALQAAHNQQALDIEHVRRGNIKSVRAALAAHSEAVVTALPGPEAGAEVSGCDPLPVARPRFCGGFAESSASAATLAAGLVGLVGEPRRDVDAAVREEHCNIAAGFGASDTPVTAPGGLQFTPRQVCSLDP
jgi:hypothetical protein